MGLDTYAMRAPGEDLTEEDLEAFEAADIQLCGGIVSGPPDSLRGKVYDDLILEITGESLYQEWIPPERVKAMYEALMKCNPGEAAGIAQTAKLFSLGLKVLFRSTIH